MTKTYEPNTFAIGEIVIDIRSNKTGEVIDIQCGNPVVKNHEPGAIGSERCSRHIRRPNPGELVHRYRVFTRTTSKPHLEAGATWQLHYSHPEAFHAWRVASRVNLNLDEVKVIDAGTPSLLAPSAI